MRNSLICCRGKERKRDSIGHSAVDIIMQKSRIPFETGRFLDVKKVITKDLFNSSKRKFWDILDKRSLNLYRFYSAYFDFSAVCANVKRGQYRK